MKANSLIIAIYLPFLSFSQSAWDIEYFQIDQVDSSFLEKPLLLDFRGTTEFRKSVEMKVGIEFSKRGYIIFQDSLNIELDDEEFLLYETRKIYPDWGLLEEQYFELIVLLDNSRLVINECKILKIQGGKILAKFFSKEEEKAVEVGEYWISKNLLDGVLVSLN